MHKRSLIPRLVILLAVCAVLIYLLLIALVCWRDAHVAPASHQQDAIIVLGAQVRPDGSPSNQLRWRVDAAAEAYRIHPSPVVVCGAQGKDEPDTEAAVMKQILLTSGVPEDDILLDSTSFNTRQNLAHAYELLKDRQIRQVLIVTSDYHLPRALDLARDLGFDATGLGSPTLGGWHWLKNHAREALSLVKYWIEKYTPFL